jgi:hypothetical protein
MAGHILQCVGAGRQKGHVSAMESKTPAKRALAALDIPAPAVDKVLRITDKVRRGIAMLVSGECKNPTDAAVRTGKAIQRASQTQQMAFCVMRAAHDSPAGSLGSRIST